MINKKEPWKKSKLKVILYLLVSWLPTSRRKLNKLNLQVLQIFAAQRELQMMTRQDVMTLANKMVKFHGAELRNEKSNANVDPIAPVDNVKDNTENMYG